ncbi:metallophosphoesterase, partial [Burkholderia multivorans]
RESTVEISAGLGFSPFSPVRFAARPEVSLLTLVPRT